MDKRIGILGYNGEIGRIVVNLLKNKYILRCGGRNLNSVDRIKSNNIEYIKVDIYDEKELHNFILGCDLIINCAGPSYFLSKIVAKEVEKQNLIYVDVFGVDILSNNLKKSSLKAVIGTGNYPGLSGLIPVWIRDINKDCIINSITVYAGGKENVTTIACIDVLISILKCFGRTNRYLSKGKIQMSTNIHNKDVPTCFPNNSFITSYLTTELIKVGKKINVKELHWFNVYVNSLYEISMRKAMAKLISAKTEKEIYTIAEQLKKDIKKEKDCSQNWYKYFIEINKRYHGEEKIEIQCGDTYKINGILTVMCAEELLNNNFDNNIYWPFDILDSKKVMSTLISEGVVKNIIINNNKELNYLYQENEVGEI